MLACELLAWTQMLAYPEHPARRWEPKRLRLRLLSVAGRLARHTRRLVLHLAAGHRWTDLLLTGRRRDHPSTPTRLTPAPVRPPPPQEPVAGPWTRPHRPNGGPNVMPTRHNPPDTGHRAGNDHQPPAP